MTPSLAAWWQYRRRRGDDAPLLHGLGDRPVLHWLEVSELQDARAHPVGRATTGRGALLWVMWPCVKERRKSSDGKWVDWMSLTAPDGRRWSWDKLYEFLADSEDDL